VIERAASPGIEIDGEVLSGGLIPVPSGGGRRRVRVSIP
jgi:hypothetical protein